MSSSMVSVPTIERRDPSSTFLTIESTCSGLASRKRSAALRSDSTSRPILKVATPWTWTLMPWLVTASLSCTLIWRAVSFSLPTRSSSGRTNVPPPTTTLTPLSPEIAIACPRSLRTLAPREPAMMSASLAPATLYRLATKAISRTRMITPATVRNGVVVTKLGIGPCSFFGRRRDRCHHEVGAGDGDHFHLVPCRNLDVGGGGQVVGSAGETDQNRAEPVGWDAHRDAAGRPDHVLEAEGLRRLCLAECLEGSEHHACPDQAGDRPHQSCPARAGVQAVEPEKAAHTEHGDEAEQHGRGRHSGDVEAQVDGPEEAAEDVVDDQGEQEESASQKEAGAEDEVGGVQALTTSA